MERNCRTRTSHIASLSQLLFVTLICWAPICTASWTKTRTGAAPTRTRPEKRTRIGWQPKRGNLPLNKDKLMLLEPQSLNKLSLDHGTYLGPARVRQLAGNRVQLEFPDELPWALLALAFPYEPAPGDIVLAAGQGHTWYVIGVLQGAGKTTFSVPGDFEILAPRGRIHLLAGKGFQLKSPEVRITAGKLELVARRVFERFENAARWVRQTLQVR